MITWSPDTCYCNYEVELNPQGKLSLISVIFKCSIHDHQGDQGAFSSALNRNNQANINGNSPEAKLNMRKSTA